MHVTQSSVQMKVCMCFSTATKPSATVLWGTAQVQQGALALVVGLTGSPDGLDKLAGAATELLPALLRLLPAAPGTSRSALTALVNLCQVSKFVSLFSDRGVAGRLQPCLYAWWLGRTARSRPAASSLAPWYRQSRECSEALIVGRWLLGISGGSVWQAPGVVERLLDYKAVDRVMDYMQEGACPHVDLMTMLLANLTAPQAGTDALLHIRDRTTAGLYL